MDGGFSASYKCPCRKNQSRAAHYCPPHSRSAALARSYRRVKLFIFPCLSCAASLQARLATVSVSMLPPKGCRTDFTAQAWLPLKMRVVAFVSALVSLSFFGDVIYRCALFPLIPASGEPSHFSVSVVASGWQRWRISADALRARMTADG